MLLLISRWWVKPFGTTGVMSRDTWIAAVEIVKTQLISSAAILFSFFHVN
jgi:hypothetical protein